MKSNVKEIYKKRLRRRRIQFLRKVILTVIIFGVAFLAYNFRDNISLLINDISASIRYEMLNLTTGGKGAYPVNLTPNSNYDLEIASENPCVLTDAYTTMYNENGEAFFTDQHRMSNPVMKTADENILIYDKGAYNYKVISKYETAYERTMTDNLLYANIAENGYVATVTESDKFLSVLTIYNERGLEAFTTSSSRKITDVSFANGGNSCIVSYMFSEVGTINTSFVKYDFNAETKLFEVVQDDILVLDSETNYVNDIAVVGDISAVFLYSNGTFANEYIYPDKISDYYTNGNYIGVYFENDELRNYYVNLYSAETEVTINFESQVYDIYISGERFYALTRDNLLIYDTKGTLLQKANVSGKFDELKVIGNSAYLLGESLFDKIII